MLLFLTALVAFAGITLSGIGTSAAADPSADDWYRLRVCESGNNYAINTGNGYYGAYQFDVGTWRSIGGSGYPNEASPATQDALALLLWQRRGWAPWACASILGLTGSPSDPPAPPAPPVGSLDVVAVSGGNATVAGWAFDPNSPGTSIQTHVYVNAVGYPFAADGGRPDVNAAYGITGGHGFSVKVPLQPGSNNVCAYSIGVASGNNALLGCRTVQYFVPIGSFDFAAESGGVAHVAGWAFDPGASAQSIAVDVYVNGSGVRLAADQPRADVNAVMGVSGQHGFAASVPLQPGDNSVCAYAIGLTGNNPFLGCRTVRLPSPIGSYDFAADAGGVANIAGWAFDPSAPAQSISVHAYVDGVPYALMADRPRADVNAVMGVSGQHGFSGSVPLQAGVNSVCVYAIGVVAGNNPFLGCRQVQSVGQAAAVQRAAPQATMSAPAVPATSSTVVAQQPSSASSVPDTTTAAPDSTTATSVAASPANASPAAVSSAASVPLPRSGPSVAPATPPAAEAAVTATSNSG